MVELWVVLVLVALLAALSTAVVILQSRLRSRESRLRDMAMRAEHWRREVMALEARRRGVGGLGGPPPDIRVIGGTDYPDGVA